MAIIRNSKISKFPKEQMTNYYNLFIKDEQFGRRASFKWLPNMNNQISCRVIKKIVYQKTDTVQSGVK
jgi:hypothetical protein